MIRGAADTGKTTPLRPVSYHLLGGWQGKSDTKRSWRPLYRGSYAPPHDSYHFSRPISDTNRV